MYTYAAVPEKTSARLAFVSPATHNANIAVNAPITPNLTLILLISYSTTTGTTSNTAASTVRIKLATLAIFRESY
jgi:hypothetical protein